jgi:hypothetical protein
MANQGNFKWEVLPAKEAEEVCGVPAEKALQIVTAFIEGSAKSEIARVFEVRVKVVSQIIQTAQNIAHRNQGYLSAAFATSPILKKSYLLK